MKVTSIIKKGMALAAAFGLVGAGVIAASATAAPVINPDATDNSITVHALQIDDEANAKQANGKENSAVTGTPQVGAVFKLMRGNYDITTTDGYEAARSATADNFSDDSKFTKIEKTTVKDGKAEFTGLKAGLYKLTQISAPAGFSPMKQALVFVPMTDPDNPAAFLKNIHVYPKNASAGAVTKTDVTTQGKPIAKGSYMDFEIKVPIRNLEKNENFTKFEVTDKISSGLVNEDPKIISVTADDQKFAKDTDFSVQNNVANKVTISFTSEGQKKLTAKAGKQLVVKLSLKVGDVDVAKGVVNEASATWATDKRPDDTTIVTPPDKPTTTVFGKLKIKNIEKGSTKELTGAEFKIFQCADKGTTGDAISIDGKDTFAAATLIGPMRATTTQMCVVETKAPAGYEKLTSPVKFTFDDATIKGATDNTVEITIENYNSSDIRAKLPLTGGAGILLFILIGGGLLGTSYYYARKKA
ncbi:MAG: SpaH/EbpB family LPXTG-anchored major pilin [Actinomycetaceae bacterium]|nr:SpaH/EbpB family LPXTG-anchored major pilin [Actinomycetaceae bacterium]